MTKVTTTYNPTNSSRLEIGDYILARGVSDLVNVDLDEEILLVTQNNEGVQLTNVLSGLCYYTCGSIPELHKRLFENNVSYRVIKNIKIEEV